MSTDAINQGARDALIETLWSKVRSLQIVLEQARLLDDQPGMVEAEFRLRAAALALSSVPAGSMVHVIYKVVSSTLHSAPTGGDFSHARVMIETCNRHDMTALQPMPDDLDVGF